MSSDESLEHYNITVTPKDANSQCTPKQTSSDQQSQSGATTTTTVSPGNFTLQTGDNDSCVYTLSAKYTSNKNSVFNGTTTIGKSQENPYTEGKTIDVKVTLKKDGAGTQIPTAIGTSTTTGTKKDVNMTICYDGNCDNTNGTAGTATTSSDSNDPCMTQIENAKPSLQSGKSKVFCYTSTSGSCQSQITLYEGNTTVNKLSGCSTNGSVGSIHERSKYGPVYIIIHKPASCNGKVYNAGFVIPKPENIADLLNPVTTYYRDNARCSEPGKLNIVAW